jgi:phosphatidylserine synthase
MRWSVGYFGVKDVFTMVNLLGGVAGIWCALTGRPEWAGYCIFAGYLFGDALDGPVARATNTGNRFGGEFDSAADHLGQGIAPALVVYAAYAAAGYGPVGVGLMAALITTATLRQARFSTTPFHFPLCYAGLPRTISGIVALALPNAVVVRVYGLWVPAAVVIAAMAVMNLVPVPYMTHKGKRRMQAWVKGLVALFLVAPVVLFVFARPYVYDFLALCGLAYTFFGWFPVRPEERRAFHAEYRRWAHEVATLR